MKQEINNVNKFDKNKLQKDLSLIKQTNKYSTRYAITFGQCSILHIGSGQLGVKSEQGFSVKQLEQIRDSMNQKYDMQAQLVYLSDKLPENLREQNQAAVLYLPKAANILLDDQEGSDRLYQEQRQIQYDKMFYDNRRKKTLNKRARFNIVFGEEQRQASQDYKQFTIKSFNNLKYLNRFRQSLTKYFGDKSKDLFAEGNYYFQDKSGIGFHGDSQKKIVICLNLGKTSTLRYFWRFPNSSQNKYQPVDLTVKHGDVYIMSEKASGHDWKQRSKYRLVHAAGSRKYIGTN